MAHGADQKLNLRVARLDRCHRPEQSWTEDMRTCGVSVKCPDVKRSLKVKHRKSWFLMCVCVCVSLRQKTGRMKHLFVIIPVTGHISTCLSVLVLSLKEAPSVSEPPT